jgi:hypothetical protein
MLKKINIIFLCYRIITNKYFRESPLDVENQAYFRIFAHVQI